MTNIVANPDPSELLSLETLLNSAAWEVGIAIVPTLDGCERQADDSSEVAVSL